MKIPQNEELRQRLASEYALGTLRGGARRRFEIWLKQDMRLQHTVDQWLEDLQPLVDIVVPQTPPPHVWTRIEQKRRQIAGSAHRSDSWLDRFTGSLGFWRGLGLTATAAAAVLAIRLFTLTPDTSPVTRYVASIASSDHQQVALVTSDAAGKNINLTLLIPPPDAGRVYELWAIPAQGGAPQSLGLITARADSQPKAEALIRTTGSIRAQLPQGMTPDTAPVLAISLEPEGGSKQAGPSGPVLFTGQWVHV